MSEWLSDDPAYVPKGERVLVRVEPVTGADEHSPAYVSFGYVCPGSGNWRQADGTKWSDVRYHVTGWQLLPKP